MRQFRWILLTLVCSLTAQAWAAGAPTVFVSTGTAGKIYSVNTASATTTLLLSTSGADYEGMVVAPDNAGTTYPFLVYACDTANSKIIRFDPNAANVEPIYMGGAGLQHPQCGRITSTGDLVVSSTDANSGLWIFKEITGLELNNAGVQTPTQLVATSGAGQGLAQKNVGDLLAVDNSHNQVLLVPAPVFGSSSPFISSGLSKPVGIARRGDGDVFVSNQGTSSIAHFNVVTKHLTTCQTFKKNVGVPFFLQMSLDNTLYVALSASTKGSVQAVNANTCALGASFSVPDPAVGIALSPSTASQNIGPGPNGDMIANFGFSALEISQISGGCTGSVVVSLSSPAALNVLIAISGLPGAADPVVNLGLDGFEAVINTTGLTGCTAKDGQTMNFQVAHQFSQGASNAEVVVCDDTNTRCQAQVTSLSQIGTWPIGGYLPQDGAVGGTKKLKCNIFLVNSHSVDTGQEQGTFCGFQSPVNTAFNGVILDAKLASTFPVGKSVPVKFKLSPDASCQSSPFITDATAILAVSQIFDSKGNTVFVPMGLISNGSSGLGQPLFKGDGNQQYLFNWDTSSCILPSGVTQACPKGTYTVSVELLTHNTALSTQSIYTDQTTLVVLK
jgi:hypothetical protein